MHVSADNRYRLWVNGHTVCSGPARGDLQHWNFETVDIARYLQPGQNTLAALVWNMGVYAPAAQISNRTAFLVQGDGKEEQVVNTDRSWKVVSDSAYNPCATDDWCAAWTSIWSSGRGMMCRARGIPGAGSSRGMMISGWLAAVEVSSPAPWGSGSDNWWTLVPRGIPLMEERQQRIPLVRRIAGGGDDQGMFRRE